MTTPTPPPGRTVGRSVPGTPEALVPPALVPGAGTLSVEEEEEATPTIPTTTGVSGVFAGRAYTEVEICNLALGMIGAGSIASLDERSREALVCRRFWPLVRQAVFEAVPWHCIAKRVTLAEPGDSPIWGFSQSYRLPRDFVRMIAMDAGDAEYQVVGPDLHTDRSPANIHYVYLCVDGTRYTAQLVRCLYLHLAYEIAFALTGSAELVEPIKADLERFFLPLARFTNGLNAGAREMQSDTLTEMFR